MAWSLCREQGAPLGATAWPTRKTEMWKYTPLTPAADCFARHSGRSSEWRTGKDGIEPIEELDATGGGPSGVYINGSLSAEPPALAEGVVRFADAHAGAEPELIKQHLGTV